MLLNGPLEQQTQKVHNFHNFADLKKTLLNSRFSHKHHGNYNAQNGRRIEFKSLALEVNNNHL